MSARGSPIDTDSGEERPNARPSIPKSSRKRRTNSTDPNPRAASIAESSSDPEVPASLCHLCCKPLGRPETKKRLRGVSFHRDCHNALKCYRRYAGSLTDKLDQMMIDQPERWRDEVKPLIRKLGELRDAAARATARTKLKEAATYTKNEIIEDKLLLNRRQFIKHMRDTEDMASSDADEEFNYRYCHEPLPPGIPIGGEKKVGVQAPQRIRITKGTSTTNKSIEQNIAAAGANRSSSPGLRRNGSERRDRQGREERSRSPLGGHVGRNGRGERGERGRRTQRTERSPRRASDDGQREPRLRKRHKQAPSPVAPTTKARSSARGASPCASSDGTISGDGDDDDSGDDYDADQQAKKASASSRSLSTPIKDKKQTAASMSPMEFMQAKSALAKRLKDAISLHSSKKGVHERVKVANDSLTPSQIDELPTPPGEVLDKVKKHIDIISGFEKKLTGAKSGGWDELQKSVEDALEDMQAAAEVAEAELKAMNYVLDLQARVEKSRKNGVGYARRRMASFLVTGGYGQSISRRLAEVFENPFDEASQTHMATDPATPTDFDPSRWTLWKAASPLGTRLHDTLMSAAAKELQGRKDSLSEFLSENTKKLGGMTRIECSHEQLKNIDIFGELPHIAHAGIHPWLVALRPYSLRFGPSSVPMPGLGSLFISCSPELDTWMVLMPASAILERGMSLSDTPTFLNSPSGMDAFASRGSSILLRPGSVLWVPFGTVCLPVGVRKCDLKKDKDKDENKKDDKKDKNKDKDMRPCFIMAFTPFLGKLVEGTPQSTWSAIKALNLGYLTRVEDRPAWTSRASIMNSFVDAAQAALCGST